jgi:hypothetical protein
LKSPPPDIRQIPPTGFEPSFAPSKGLGNGQSRPAPRAASGPATIEGPLSTLLDRSLSPREAIGASAIVAVNTSEWLQCVESGREIYLRRGLLHTIAMRRRRAPIAYPRFEVCHAVISARLSLPNVRESLRNVRDKTAGRQPDRHRSTPDENSHSRERRRGARSCLRQALAPPRRGSLDSRPSGTGFRQHHRGRYSGTVSARRR